jgi:peptidoglycan-associated lipoprotein
MKRTIITIVALFVLLFVCQPLISQNKNIKTADLAFQQYQYQVAAENYQKAIKQTKSGSEEQNHCIHRMAEISMKSGDWKQSVSWFNRIAKNGYLDKHPTALYQFAVVQQFLGDNSTAETLYRKYLGAFPNDTLVQRKLDGLLASKNQGFTGQFEVTNEKILNSRNDDFGLIFLNKKGDELMLSSNRKDATGKDTDQWKGAQFSDLFIAKTSKNGALQRPFNADENGILNTQANEGVPFIADNYSTLYFTRCEKYPKTKTDSVWCVILKTTRSGSRWTKPELVLGNSTGNVGQPALTSDELTMVYAGSQTGGFGNKDLWVVQRESTRKPFQNPVNPGSNNNTAGDELFPYFLNDSTLYFASDGLGGFGGLDIFVTYRNQSGSWSIPQNLGNSFNTNRDDFGIIFKDKKMESGYFCSNRDGGLGGDDIFSFKKMTFQRSLAGKITDAGKSSAMPKQAVLLISKADTAVAITDIDGRYKFENENIQEETDYTILVEKENYFSQRVPFSTSGIQGDHEWVVDIVLSPIPESPIVLPEIRYELNKWDLQPQYQDSLRVMVKTLKDNPKLQIELRSHTDSRATEQYNKELSQNRAQTVVDFLINEGIEPGRLIAKGYGKTSPRMMEADYKAGDLVIPKGTVLNDDYLNSLTKPEWKEVVHQLNRRTELVVIAKNYQK